MEDKLEVLIRQITNLSSQVTDNNDKINTMNTKYEELSTYYNTRTSDVHVRSLQSPRSLYERDLEQEQATPISPNEDECRQERGHRKVDKFEEFSGYTTLHGLRFIGDRTSILPRRLFWVLLVLLCGTLCGLQTYDRFVYYLSSPITVNVQVNYPDKMAFPAVTFCNQNKFRISKAYEGDWQDFLVDFYGSKNDDIPLSSEPHLNTSISELFEGLAHNKEDFIVKCQFGTEECSAANFTTTLTSHGVCFTFNKVNRLEDSLAVQAAGVGHALRLTLNTEYYEYLNDNVTGIKMLVTDQNEVPRVEEIGLPIPTDVHAFVEISDVLTAELPLGGCLLQGGEKPGDNSTERL